MRPDVMPVEEATAAWSESPAYRVAYDALGGKFALASATIEGRATGCTSQQQTADASAPTPHTRRTRTA